MPMYVRRNAWILGIALEHKTVRANLYLTVVDLTHFEILPKELSPASRAGKVGSMLCQSRC